MKNELLVAVAFILFAGTPAIAGTLAASSSDSAALGVANAQVVITPGNNSGEKVYAPMMNPSFPVVMQGQVKDITKEIYNIHLKKMAPTDTIRRVLEVDDSDGWGGLGAIRAEDLYVHLAALADKWEKNPKIRFFVLSKQASSGGTVGGGGSAAASGSSIGAGLAIIPSYNGVTANDKYVIVVVEID